MTCFRDDGRDDRRDEKDFQTFPVHGPLTPREKRWILVGLLILLGLVLRWRGVL